MAAKFKPVSPSSWAAVHPRHVAGLSRRQLLRTGCALTAYAPLGRLLWGPRYAMAQSNTSFTVQRRLIWINMAGGWDLLEVMDPKAASTAGIDMIYNYGDTHSVGSEDGVRLGRWLPRMAEIGNDLLLVRGMAMGTTSHSAGSVYMNTGILSNTGVVNSASIPAIVASESVATIPIIQLNGGAPAPTDRGLLKPVSVVRAQNLELYRSMYPESEAETARRLLFLDYLRDSAQAYQEATSTDAFAAANNDRLQSLVSAEAKVRGQFEQQVGQTLALTSAELAAFTEGSPAGLRRGTAQTFALAQKLIQNRISDCINVGVGGFDTHQNQSASLEGLLGQVDFLVSRLVAGLRASGDLQDTLIVMYSDFGRTPRMNGGNGRDHWPVGGALMIGGGIAGGRVVGGTNDAFRAELIDPATGAVDATGIQLSPIHLAGSVLALTLGSGYLSYRNYLSELQALTRLGA